MFQLLNSVNSSYISILWNMMQTLKICFWKYTSNDVKSLQCNIVLGGKLCIQSILILKIMYIYKCNKTIRNSVNVR